jgi:hypothetical protein
VEGGRRKIDAAGVGVGRFGVEPISARADDGAKNDMLGQVMVVEGGMVGIRGGVLVLAEGDDVRPRQVGFEAVGKADGVSVQMVGGRGGDDADDAGGMDRTAMRSADFHARNNLSAGGEQGSHEGRMAAGTAGVNERRAPGVRGRDGSRSSRLRVATGGAAGSLSVAIAVSRNLIASGSQSVV